MRTALLLTTAAAAAAVVGFFLVRPADPASAAGTSTLHVTGLDIGKGEKALVRLHNAGDSSFVVNYTIFAVDTLNDSPVALSLPGAGDGARIFSGDTLELDLGPIVDAYRAQQEVGPWDAPIRFVAFGTSSGDERFGPETIVAEALQVQGRATYEAVVTWTDD